VGPSLTPVTGFQPTGRVFGPLPLPPARAKRLGVIVSKATFWSFDCHSEQSSIVLPWVTVPISGYSATYPLLYELLSST